LRLRAVLRFAVRRAGFLAAAFFTARFLFLAMGIYSSLLPFGQGDSRPQTRANMKLLCQSRNFIADARICARTRSIALCQCFIDEARDYLLTDDFRRRTA
jgi:hypothetical protein